MKKLSIVVLLIAVVVGTSVLSTYIVRRDEIASRHCSVDQAWNHVSSTMQRRADLVPAILASTKASAARHRDLVAEIEQARTDVQSGATPVDTIAANRRLDAAVSRLFALQQDDPDLLVNRKFFAIQDQWAIASNRVAPERNHYDHAVQSYNAFISEFPNDVFARWASYAPMENYFHADANAASRTTAALMQR